MIGKRNPPSKTQGTGVNRGLTLGNANALGDGNLTAAQLLDRKEAIEAANKVYMEANNLTAEDLARASKLKVKQVVVSDIRTRKSDVNGLRKRKTTEQVVVQGVVAGVGGTTGSSPSKKEERKSKKKTVPKFTQEELLSEGRSKRRALSVNS